MKSVKSFFSGYLSDENWVVREDEWSHETQHTHESQFSQGNGFIGLRGILEEVPKDAMPGTFIAGLYDKISAQQPELINLPNPIHFKISIAERGEKLGAVAMDSPQFKRCLDLKKAFLFRHTLYEDTRKRKFDYQSLRFVSMKDKNVIGMKICITSLDADAEITVKTDIDVSTSNAGVLTEGYKRHFQIIDVHQSAKNDYVCVKTLEKGTYVTYVSYLMCEEGRKKRVITDHAFNIKLKKGKTVCFTKIITVTESNEQLPAAVEKSAMDKHETHLKKGFDKLLDRHINEMKKIWRVSDIYVKGDPEIRKAMRFNVYHMLICVPCDEGKSSVGAKTLSGEGYRGHIFWDTEIFLFPFYLLTHPEIARNMLLYRFYRLDAARENARKNGFKGAQFPWESADTGEETTPDWHKNYDGRIIKVETGRMEHHITSDIAYAVYYYYLVTNDEDFMLKYGYEIIIETARFWASRVKLCKKSGSYEIRHVIGPDELHENVNNNAYTNLLVKWHLQTAARMSAEYKKKYRKSFSVLAKRIKLKEGGPAKWKKIASKIKFNLREDGVIEQFDGYFKKKRVRITKFDENGLADFPVGLDLTKVGRTQFLKQADVLMLIYLFSTNFSQRMKRKNYDYYEPRTLHKSSLSPSIHSITASDIGDYEKAYFFFKISAFMDYKDAFKSTKNGIHAACLGGSWQAVINGFGGVRIEKDRLSFKPSLPPGIKQLGFNLRWRDVCLKVLLDRKRVKIKIESKRKGAKTPVKIYGKSHELKSRKIYLFQAPKNRKKKSR